MLKGRLEQFLGFIILILSLVTSSILQLLGLIYFKSRDRDKLKTNLELSKKRDNERDEKLQAIEKKYPLNVKREKILKMPEQDLIKALLSRSLKSKEVVEAFIAKAAYVTRRCNCVAEFIPEALEWAAELDALEELKGPLHGLPVSIKEHINIKGHDSTMGFAQFLYRPAQDDSVIVKALKQLGAVPFCKTNVPQSLFTYGCGNSIYGETLNPRNLKLSPGGSSGGCTALIASGGSVLSVGSDVGGSVRIPAHFCGVTGMKPTSCRMSKEGLRNTGVLMIPIASSIGFMAKNSEMLVYAYKALYESGLMHQLDPLAVPIPWNEMMFTRERKLRFGYFTTNSYFPSMGDTEEVILQAKQKLEQAGFQVVKFTMPDMQHVVDTFFQFALSDRGDNYKRTWRGEAVDDAAFSTYWLTRLRPWMKRWLANIIEFKVGPIKTPLIYSPLMAKLLRAGDKTWKTKGLWRKVIERKAIMDYIINQWHSKHIDVLMMPTFPFPALPYNLPGKILPGAVYTLIWNLLDFPAGVVPFGPESGKRLSEYDTKDDFILRMALKGAQQSVGMPISVQLVGLPSEDEMVLKAMTVIESLK